MNNMDLRDASASKKLWVNFLFVKTPNFPSTHIRAKHMWGGNKNMDIQKQIQKIQKTAFFFASFGRDLKGETCI